MLYKNRYIFDTKVLNLIEVIQYAHLSVPHQCTKNFTIYKIISISARTTLVKKYIDY